MCKSDKFSSITRFVPLIAIGCGVTVFFILGLQDYFSIDRLRYNHAHLSSLVSTSWYLSALVFVAIYFAITSLSLPWGAFLTVVGGFLFGPIWGPLLVIIGATSGAHLIFIVARSSIGHALRRRVDKFLQLELLQRTEIGFKANAFNYMLFLRLMPIFPFFMVNLIAAFFGINSRSYFFGTIIGIIPGTIIYSFVGSGLNTAFQDQQPFSLDNVLTAEMLGGLVGLGVMSIIPIAYKFFAKNRS